MEAMFFDGWASLVRTGIVGVMAYCFLVMSLRVSGKRTLAKMNAFDWVVTVALGSTLATILLSKDVSLAQGVLALSLLIGMQFAVTWTGVRVGWVRGVVSGEPALLVYRGEFLPTALLKERVNEEDIFAAVRSAGIRGLGEVEAVVLETDGSFSVLPLSGKRSGKSSIETLRLAGQEEDPE